MSRTFVTGCDRKTEWTLQWFLSNFRKHNPTAKITFCDFGVSKEVLVWAEKNFDHVIHSHTFETELNYITGLRWFLKPYVMTAVEDHMKVWIDTDCEVLGNVSPIFERLVENKINIVRDLPWTARRKEVWHNTGVFGVIGNPRVLYDWVSQCRVMMNPYSINMVPMGDQDALHELVGQDPMRQMIYINELPNIYNWLRIQLIDGQDDPKKLIMHWTGNVGKEFIKKKIQNQENQYYCIYF